MALFKYKGNRIRASDQHLVYRFCMGTLILLFLCIVVLLNLKQIVHTDWENFNLTKMEFSLSSYSTMFRRHRCIMQEVPGLDIPI